MRGRVVFYLLTILAMLRAGDASATLMDVCATHNQFKADDGPCPKEFPFFTKKQSCVDACKKASDGAVWARIVCNQHAEVDNQLIAEGEKAAQEAAAKTEQKQNSNETSNATNMTAGHEIELKREANDQQMVPVFQICNMLAIKCDQEGGDGNPVSISCSQALGALQNEMNNLHQSATQMEKKSEKSTKNADTLTNKVEGTKLTSAGKADISATEAEADSSITVPNGSSVGMFPVGASDGTENSGSSSSPGAGAYGAGNGAGASGSGSVAGGLGKGGAGGTLGMQPGNLDLLDDGSGAGDRSGKSGDGTWNLAGGRGSGAPTGAGDAGAGWLNPAGKDSAAGGGMVSLGGAAGKKGDAGRGPANWKGSLPSKDSANMSIFDIMHRRYGRLRSDGQI